MAVHVTTKYFSVLGHALYLKFKTGADRSFAFKFKRFTQRSMFWKHERWLVYAAFFSVQLTLEHRTILDPSKK